MTSGMAVSALTAALLFNLSTATAGEHARAPEGTSKEHLWLLLDSMAKRMPLTATSFNDALDTPVYERENEDSKDHIWRGEPFALREDLGVSDLELGLDDSNRFRYASVTVHGLCIRYKEVKEKYGPLIIVDTPKGHTPFDDTLVQSRQSWGSYYFTFLDIARDCLHKVSLSPRREEGI